jgi:hypothetical protein
MPKERFSTQLKDFYDTLTGDTVGADITALETCYKAMIADKGQYDGSFNCTDISGSPTFQAAYGTLLDKAYNNTSGNDTYSKDISDLQGGISNIQNEPGYMSHYKEVKDLHNKLDNQMREIYNPDMEDVHIMHSSTVYMSLAWTVLATSVLYFLFQKL